MSYDEDMTGRPRNNERRQEQQDKFLAAFTRTGVITRAATEAGIVAPQHHRWLKEDGKYAARFAELKRQTAEIAQQARRKPGPPKGYSGGLRAERKHENQEKFLAALASTGIILDAARETGLSQAVHNLWMRTDAGYATRAAEVIRNAYDARREAIRSRQSKGSKKAWDNENRRTGWSEFQKEAWTPEKRAEASLRISRRLADPAQRAVWEIASRARWDNPEAHVQNTERMKRLWADPAYRERVLSTMRTPERRYRASEQMKQQWSRVPLEERRDIMRKRRRIYKGGYHITQIETIVMAALGDLGVFYRVHEKINGYVADILAQPDLVIECDGAWFHDQRKGTDKIRDQRLAELGYRTLRLPEQEIKDGSFVTKLQEALK